MNEETRALIIRIRQENVAVRRRLDMLDAAEEVILSLKDAPPLDLPGIMSVKETERTALNIQREMIEPPAGGIKDKSPRRGSVPLEQRTIAGMTRGEPLPPPTSKRTNTDPRRLREGQRFKGVRTIKSSNGSTKYQTSYWDPKLKKSRGAGTFDDELEAALTVAQKISDVAEIQRISGLIEQQENNPARTSKRQEPPAEPGQKIAWECNKCCTPHDQAERPKVCKKCLKDNGFYKVPPRPKKNEE